MLHCRYAVVDAGLVHAGGRTTYVCGLRHENGHGIEFSLALNGAESNEEHRMWYNAIAPHLKRGVEILCDFVFRDLGDSLLLCLVGFSTLGDDGNVKEQISFSGIIQLEGEVYIPLDIRKGRQEPVFHKFGDYRLANHILTWRSKHSWFGRLLLRLGGIRGL